MKGIAPIIVIVVFVLIAGAVGGYMILSSDTASQSRSINSIAIPNEIKEHSTSEVTVLGDIFEITCDNNLYTFLIEDYIYCDVTNLKDEVIEDIDMSLVFNPEIANIQKAYLWDENAVNITYIDVSSNEYEVIPANATHEEYIKEWTEWTTEPVINYGAFEETNKVGNSVNGLTFGKNETKHFKLLITAPVFTSGKFDVIAGYDVLDPWWSSAWADKQAIYLNKSVASTLTNQTYIIFLDTASLVTAGHLNSDCSDIRFLDSTETTEINWNFGDYDDSTYGCNAASTELHLRIPTVSANSTALYLYYNNPTASLGNSSADTYDESYKWVAPLGEANIDILDKETVTYSANVSETAGKLGNGIQTLSEFSRKASISSAATTDYNTMGAWYYPTAASDAGGLWQFGNVGLDQNRVYSSAASPSNFTCYDGTQSITAQFQMGANDWYHVVCMLNGTGLSIWVNGTYHGYNAAAGAKSISDISLIAEFADADADYARNGIYDQAFLYEGGLTHDQIKTLYDMGQYNSQLWWLGDADTRRNYTVISEDYDAYVYETEDTVFNISIETPSAATVIGVLSWNGTEYSATTTANSTPTAWSFNRTIPTDLIITNNTALSFFWNFSLQFANGSMAYESEYPVNQYGLWAYSLSTPQANVTVPETTTTIRLNTTLTKENSNSNVYNIYTQFNNTSYMATQSGLLYYKDVITPIVGVNSKINYNFSMNVRYGDNIILRESSTSYVTVAPIQLVNCSAGGYMPALRYRHWNEESPHTAISEPMEISINLYKTDYTDYASYNFSFAANQTHEICITPNTSDAYVDTFTTYSDTATYPIRHHFLRNQLVSNETLEIDLYSLNSTYASNILFKVYDTRGVRLPNLIVKAQRYYPEENTYRYVDMGLTDTNGETILKLRGNDVYHIMTVYNRNTLLQQFSQMIITSTEVILNVVNENLISYWDHYGDVSFSCMNETATWQISCSYQVLDGSSKTLVLSVDEIGATKIANICEETDTGSSGTLVCNAGDWSDRYLTYSLYVSGSHVMLTKQDINQLFSSEFGVFGLFYFIVLLTGMVFAGMLIGPAGAGVTGIIGILLGLSMNMLNISTAGITSIILVLIIIVVRNR